MMRYALLFALLASLASRAGSANGFSRSYRVPPEAIVARLEDPEARQIGEGGRLEKYLTILNKRVEEKVIRFDVLFQEGVLPNVLREYTKMAVKLTKLSSQIGFYKYLAVFSFASYEVKGFMEVQRFGEGAVLKMKLLKSNVPPYIFSIFEEFALKKGLFSS